METFAALAGIAGALALGTMSPGPSFLMVARTAIARSRADGLAAAFGMGVGGVLFAAAALLGLQAVLLAVPSLYVALKILGGAYLVFIGVMVWRGARQPVDIDEARPAERRAGAFWLALATQLSNPKTAVVYASVFAALLPAEVPLWATLVLAAVIFALETGWYAIVALALSAPSPRAGYLRFKVWIDRAAGAVMAVLGLRLILGSK
jgi:threonine/homoserine/homoserine lactone efflux protein